MLKIFLTMFLLMSCGNDPEYRDPPPHTHPPSNGGGSGSTPSYAETQALLDNYCGACHANAQFMGSERALRGSAASSRVRARNMPPSNATRKLPDAERSKILAFF